jgi:ribosomal protein S27E
MENDYLTNLSETHELFTECIGASSPIGYNERFKHFITWLENFNKKNNCKIQISQIKMKFGYLTIYVHSSLPESSCPGINHIQKVYEKIAELSADVQKVCNVCGKALVESVYKSSVVWLCFEHMKSNYTDYAKYRKRK